MGYGFETYRADSSKILDGTSKGNIFLGVLTIPATSASGSASYTQCPADALFCYNVDAGSHDFNTTSPDSYGRINWTQRTGSTKATRLLVMARKVNVSTTHGILLTNDAGETLADYNYPVPQYLGSLTPGATASSTYQTPEGINANVHITPASYAGAGTNRVVLVNMPDSGTNDIWYACNSYIDATVTGGYTVSVTVFAPAGTAYQVPSLHVFSLDGPVAASAGEGIQLFDSGSHLVFDSGAENMSVKASTVVNYPAVGSTITYTLSLPTTPAILIPYFYRWDSSAAYVYDNYLGVAKRVGNQITFKTIHTEAHNPGVSNIPSYQDGASSNSYCAVVDVAQLGASSATGTPNPAVQTPVSISTHPTSQTVSAGSSVTFTVVASGSPAPSYKWQRNNVDIAGATSASYTFTTSSGNNGDTYRCYCENTLNGHTTGAISNSATLTVTSGGGGGTTPPSVYSSPSSQTVAVGGSISFSCGASGDGTLSYTWYKGSTSVGTGSTYTISSVSSGDAGTYYCHVSSVYGTADSGSATLTVTSTGSAPTITSSPSSQTLATGATASFSVSATGTATLTYAWYKSGSSTVLGTSSSYSFPASTTTAGGYYCVVTNGYGTATSSTATLSIAADASPVISLQPSNTTCTQNQAIYMNCAASPVTSYEWFKGGASVGAGSSYLVDTSVVGTFTYYCICRNNTANTQSSSVTLTVNAPATTTFSAYNNVSSTVSEIDANAYWSINSDGSTSTTAWAVPPGDGSLYNHTATLASGSYVAVAGSGALGTAYTGSATWGEKQPVSTLSGASRTCTLTITSRLNSGGTVCTHSITLTSTNS